MTWRALSISPKLEGVIDITKTGIISRATFGIHLVFGRVALSSTSNLNLSRSCHSNPRRRAVRQVHLVSNREDARRTEQSLNLHHWLTYTKQQC